MELQASGFLLCVFCLLIYPSAFVYVFVVAVFFIYLFSKRCLCCNGKGNID